MARMIPERDPETIDNYGERVFYEACLMLPENYTVLYAFRYLHQGSSGEADFVILNPDLGYIVVEVKEGIVACFNGVWCRQVSGNDFAPLNDNPVEQAERAMHYILKRCREESGSDYLPLSIRYAVAFPEASKITGNLPADLAENSIFLLSDLENLEPKILSVFGDMKKSSGEQKVQAAKLLLERVLAPSCRFLPDLEERIKAFYSQADHRLTAEQEQILEATELNRKMLFLGAAGTGKTFIAVEKGKKLCREKKRVFLTCYNKFLSHYLRDKLADLRDEPIVIMNFFDYIFEELQKNDPSLTLPQDNAALSDFYNITLPEKAFDYYSTKDEGEKFDALIVDEGQDFRGDWLTCLESMCKKEHEFYVFADPNQEIFGSNIHEIKNLEISKHRLTGNLRNTEEINDWMKKVMPEAPAKSLLKFKGEPVQFFPWKTPEEEGRLIAKEIGHLVSQGIPPHRIVILSPNVREKSCLAGLEKIRKWPLVTYEEPQPNAIRFSTIRAFKGLEADIVFLIGLRPDTPACTRGDIYVGGSRARFLLYIFHREDTDPGWVGVM